MAERKRLLVLHAVEEKNRTSSYQTSYIHSLKETPVFDCTIVNVVTADPIRERWNRWRHIWWAQYDAVLLLHSIFASTLKLSKRWIDATQDLDVPVVFFINNEFYRMPQKMSFAKEVRTSLIVSQCFSKQVLDVYSEALGCPAIGLPNVCFDLRAFPLGSPIGDRLIDVGYRMMPGPASLGHWEREDIAAIFEQKAADRFKLDISLDPKERFTPREWSRFLRRCRTQLCVASGGDIFELSDETLWRTFNFTKANPNASRAEIEALFPPVEQRIPLRTLSSRMIEAASSGTAQIMYEYDIGLNFEPDVHYIALKKDHSNMSDVLDRVADNGYLSEIASNCFRDLQHQTSSDVTFSKLDRALDNLL
jgi:hypothetical protein